VIKAVATHAHLGLCRLTAVMDSSPQYGEERSRRSRIVIERVSNMKKVLIAALLLGCVALATGARADILFLVNQGIINVDPGGSFAITADLSLANPAPGESYLVDGYSLAFTPALGSPVDVLESDTTGFDTLFKGTVDDTTTLAAQPFLTFDVDPSAAPNLYNVDVSLIDASGNTLATSPFTLNIRAPLAPPVAGVPEPAACAMLLSGFALPVLRLRRKSTK